MLMKVLVPWLNQYVDERWTYVTITFLTVLFVEVGWNAVMPFIYLNKIPFFEQYRHNPDVKFNLFRNLGLGKMILNIGTLF